MAHSALKTKSLSKRYRIGRRQSARYLTLRESFMEGLKSPFRRDHSGGPSRWVWALNGIDLDVTKGEVLGIIGRNGSGKTTLLKVIGRITSPTSGFVEVNGRVGSLLAVGTGFHPELTGRENIYLNGAILGMRRSEVSRRFDEIVEFAGVEEFLETPVKHFSSGMHMRLAFAVAAHLETEILLVDEVLAVGDAAFQRKCLGKMGDVAREGRTVLFVSHNLGAISHLCQTGMVLKEGAAVFKGKATEAVDWYVKDLRENEAPNPDTAAHVLYAGEMGQSEEFAVTRIEVLDQQRRPKVNTYTWDDVVVRVWYTCRRRVERGSVVLELRSSEGSQILLLSTQPDSNVPLVFEPGDHYVECELERLPLAAGEYILGAALAEPNTRWLWQQEHLAIFTVLPNDVFGSGMPPLSSRALVATPHRWLVPS